MNCVDLHCQHLFGIRVLIRIRVLASPRTPRLRLVSESQLVGPSGSTYISQETPSPFQVVCSLYCWACFAGKHAPSLCEGQSGVRHPLACPCGPLCCREMAPSADKEECYVLRVSDPDAAERVRAALRKRDAQAPPDLDIRFEGELSESESGAKKPSVLG